MGLSNGEEGQAAPRDGLKEQTQVQASLEERTVTGIQVRAGGGRNQTVKRSGSRDIQEK